MEQAGTEGTTGAIVAVTGVGALEGGAVITHAGTVAIAGANNLAVGAVMMAAPNGGNGPKHGGTAHDDAINKEVGQLQNDPSVTNIRKNQRQVDVNGNEVGKNLPDIQYDQGGCHNCVEYDTVPSNGSRHQKVIQQNDPSTKIHLKTP